MKRGEREEPPSKRPSENHKIYLGGNIVVHFTVGFYPDGRVAEVFINASREGDQFRELMKAFAAVVSLSIQYGMPMDRLLNAMRSGSQGLFAIPSALADLIEQCNNGNNSKE